MPPMDIAVDALIPAEEVGVMLGMAEAIELPDIVLISMISEKNSLCKVKID